MKQNSKRRSLTAIIAGIIIFGAAVIAVAILSRSPSKEATASTSDQSVTKADAAPQAASSNSTPKHADRADTAQPEEASSQIEFRIDPLPKEPTEIKASRGGYLLIAIPGGQYPMGVNSEFKAHAVTIKSFYLGKFEVTNEEYARFLKANPDVEKPPYWTDEMFNKPKQPVVGVTWNEAKKYCDWAGLRLPTEAEWEWAARAGSRSAFINGDYESDLDKVAWFGGNANGLQPVGTKAANKFGLYDIIGNVWEWMEDDYHPDYKGAPSDGSAWVDSPRALRRVIRGGSFNYSSDNCRSAYRGVWETGVRDFSMGFRAAKSMP